MGLSELQAKRDELLRQAQVLESAMQIINGGNGGSAIEATKTTGAVPMGSGVVTLQDATVTPKRRGRPAKAKTTTIKVTPKVKKSSAPRDPATAHKGGRRPTVSADEMKERVLAFVSGGATETDTNGYSVETIQKGLDTNRPAAFKAIQALREEGALVETTGKGKGWRFRASGTASTVPTEAPAEEAPTETQPPAEVFTDPYLGGEEDAPVEVDDDAEEDAVEEPATVNFGS